MVPLEARGDDVAVDIDAYLAVLGERCELPARSDVELRRGQFHDVLLTPTTAYRFPRSEYARRLLPERAVVLSALATLQLGFSVPKPGAAVNATEPVGRCFMAISRVPGQPLTAINGGAMAATDRDLVGAELGRVLTALAGATAHLAPVLNGTASEADRWAAFAAGVEQHLFPLMSQQGRDRARGELDEVLALPVPPSPALVHNDLGGDNVLWELDSSLRVAGVIDWDELGLGNPANDVASIAATHGWTVAACAAQSLDDPESAVDQARSIHATFALQQALPAMRSGHCEPRRRAPHVPVATRARAAHPASSRHRVPVPGEAIPSSCDGAQLRPEFASRETVPEKKVSKRRPSSAAPIRTAVGPAHRYRWPDVPQDQLQCRR